jgi:ubiquinone/menaquinone biosynthesis C-methylase UbiE
MVLKTALILVGSFAVIQALFRVFLPILRRSLSANLTPALCGIYFDSAFRKVLYPPGALVRRMGLSEMKGSRVLEVGCGSGAFTVAAAEAMGGKGVLYAMDINPKMLRRLVEKLKKRVDGYPSNLTLINGSAYRIPFEENSFDLVFMVAVLQEIPDGLKALREIRRILKPGGTLAVTELLEDLRAQIEDGEVGAARRFYSRKNPWGRMELHRQVQERPGIAEYPQLIVYFTPAK